MNRLRISRPADVDIARFLDYSRGRFGQQAAERYHSLLLRAFALIRDDPAGCSVGSFDGVPASLCAFHLKAVPQGRPRAVKRPRHLVIFRIGSTRIEIVRVLHERMDRKRHLA